MRFHNEELAAVEFLRRVRLQKGHQPLHELRNYFRVVVQLDGNDAQVVRWR
jgi:hypothetical protein